VRGEHPTSLLGDYAALAAQSPLATDLGLAQDAPQEVVAAAVRTWLEHHHRWLLILDNVEEPQAAVDLLSRSATGHVLLTSQAETGWEPLADPLPMEVLSPTDTAGFLLARTAEHGLVAEAAAVTLASALGGLPLALEQAGAYVAATGTITLDGYAELFASRALELLNRGQPLGYQHTVATTWSLALQRLQDSEPAAVGLLTLAAFVAPDDLPQPLLTTYADRLPEPLGSAALDPLALGDAVAALRRYSLMRVSGDGLFVHRLLQTVVQADLDADAQRVWAAAAVQLVAAGFPHHSDEVASWPECQRLLPHTLAAANQGQRLRVEPETCLWLQGQAALYLWSRGQYGQARTLQEKTLAGQRRVLGDDHHGTLQSIRNLALIYWALGDLQDARRLQEEALAGYRHVLGNDHPDTLGSMNNLAVVRRALGDLQGARKLQEEALAGQRRVLGEDHPDTLVSMNNLAVTHYALRDLESARRLQEQTLAGRRRVLGDDHPRTLQSMNNLAAALAALGDLQGARDLFEQALAGQRRVLGEDHPETLQLMHNIAEIRWGFGDLQGAHDLHQQTLTARRRVLGPDHPDTLQSMNKLAEVRNLSTFLRRQAELFTESPPVSTRAG
jgi:tetratricopeptide (TPR) repeat protein